MSVHKRKYGSYKQYINHQARKVSKLGTKKKKFSSNVKSFQLRIKEFIKYFKGENVLCLGARFGEEVVALRRFGYKKTIGIDLNPDNSEYVIQGDFHNMPFEKNSFDSIYTNCIDHAWDVKLLFSEVNRVLVVGGVFILEIPHIIGVNKKSRKLFVQSGSKYESVTFDKISDISKQAVGFELIKKIKGNYKRIIAIFEKKEDSING